MLFRSNYTGVSDALYMNHVTLRQFLSSQMKPQEMNDAMTFLFGLGNGSRMLTDTLGGTPLNDAIVLAPKIVNDFRARNKLEIVNTIFLTDGGSNGWNGVKNAKTCGLSRYFYTDKVSGKNYEIDPTGWSNIERNTSTFLKILKDQTGCNLIGFFLYDGNFNRFMRQFYEGASYEFEEKAKKFWTDNKFYPVTSQGYDEYYVINGRAMEEGRNDLVIDPKSTSRKMAQAFSKFSAKKTTNRILLRRFIERVAEQAKIA